MKKQRVIVSLFLWIVQISKWEEKKFNIKKLKTSINMLHFIMFILCYFFLYNKLFNKKRIHVWVSKKANGKKKIMFILLKSFYFVITFFSCILNTNSHKVISCSIKNKVKILPTVTCTWIYHSPHLFEMGFSLRYNINYTANVHILNKYCNFAKTYKAANDHFLFCFFFSTTTIHDFYISVIYFIYMYVYCI